MILNTRHLATVLASLLVMAGGLAAADLHRAKGVTVELVADAAAVVPGQSLNLGVIFRPEAGFHTYWRQPGLVGLTPTVEWTVPSGVAVGDLLWPEPQRGKMGAYEVWCLRRDVALVAPVRISADLDPETTPQITVRAKIVWMVCSRTCHPGSAELSLTLPVRASLDAVPHEVPSGDSELLQATLREQPVTNELWKFTAVRHGEEGGFSLTITPPPGSAVPDDAYFYGHQRLVDSNVAPVRVDLGGGMVRIDLAPVEEPDATPKMLIGELWSAGGWAEGKSRRLLNVRAPLTVESRKP